MVTGEDVYGNVISAIRKIVHDEGLAGLYRCVEGALLDAVGVKL